MSKAFQKHLIICHLANTIVTSQIHYKTEIAGPLHDRRDLARTDAYTGRITTVLVELSSRLST